MRQLEDGNDRYFQADIANIQRNFPRGTYVAGNSGLEVTTDGTNTTVDVAAGTASILNDTSDVAATSVTVSPADTFLRYDLLIVDETFTVTTIDGLYEKKTEALPENNLLLAIIAVRPDATTIETGDVLDARLLNDSTAISSDQTGEIYTQSTEPTNPSENDIWFQTP
jgi:hypothetical protein